ncbi:putative short-chain dehydrogenases/reductase [Amylocarpus encephaloides]|uniref:Short-chain dehydrogenases/reductase n=1 Tax=Amylocarpus encephaloides TaxID=45428 RepID=A0A9P7YFZ5_9HELO|nr:putative short-chain dehydrogenases/reductase [Amylocarpus encephaloides]
MPSYLITGASRGLGLAFATELIKNNENKVIATARNTTGSSGLQDLKKQYPDSRLVLFDLDVSKPESIQAAAKATEKLLPNGLDNLISNAGVSYSALTSFEEMGIEDFTNEVNFNITTPILLLKEFVPLVRKSEAKRILVITSVLGSIQLGASMPGLANGYSVGKAALNMLIRKWSAVLKGDGITTALLHPGWVGATEIGDGIAPWVRKYAPDLENLSEEQSAADCMKVLNGLTSEDNGEYFNHDGTKLPW